MSHKRSSSRVAGGGLLLLGMTALVVTARTASISWQALLTPYADGTPIVGEFRIVDMGRGAGNDVVLLLGRPGEPPTIQLHILPRGAWPGVRETRSFSIGYETPHSPAPERDAVTEIVAQAVGARDHGLPSPSAIPLRPGDATVLPWWLETLRGGRGLLLGGALALLALIAAMPSRAATLTSVAWGAACLIASGTGVPAWPVSVGAPWSLVIALALALPVLRLQTPPPRDAALAFAVLLVALALRLGLGPWGPLHVNGQGPRFIDGVVRNPDEIALYGPGFVELFAPIARLAPNQPDRAVFAANAVLSALAASFVFGIERLTGIARPAALVAALIVAFDPISLRMSATESSFPPIIALVLAAAILFLLATSTATAGRSRAVALTLGAAGLLLAQAARSHPVAWPVIACIPFVALAAASGTPVGRVCVAAVGAALAAGLCCASSAGALLDVFGNIRGGALMQPRPPQSPATVVLVVGVIAAVYAIVAPRRWLAVPAALSVALWLLTRHGYDQSWLWQQAYDRLYLAIPLVALAGAVPAPLARRVWPMAIIALVLLVTWLRLGWPIVTARTTDHAEYRWLRAQLAALPAECRIVHLVSAEKRVLGVPSYLPATRPAVAVDPRQPHTLAAALTPSTCSYYVRTSLCSSPEAAADCAALEARLVLDPVARTELPAVPSSHLLAYTSDPVQTVIFRIRHTHTESAPEG